MPATLLIGEEMVLVLTLTKFDLPDVEVGYLVEIVPA